MNKAVIYLDLDGVLADFVGAAMKAHGQYIPRPDVRWDFYNQFDPPMSEADFWKPLGFDFWNGIQWTNEGKKFLERLEKVNKNRIVLMTSPCDTPGGVEGKIAWIRREMPEFATGRRFFIGSPKDLAAGPSKLLIDDNDSNVEKFRAEGGSAVLIPRPWNKRSNESWGLNGDFPAGQIMSEVALNLIRIDSENGVNQ